MSPRTIFRVLLILLCVITYFLTRNTKLDFGNSTSECEDNLRMPNQVIIDKSEIYLHVGDTAYLKATVLPIHSIKNVSWDCMNPEIASVDCGTIIGKSIGNTYVTVSTLLGSTAAQCTIHVVDANKGIPKNKTTKK